MSRPPKGPSSRSRRIPRIPGPPIPSRRPQPPAPTAEPQGERLQKLLAAAGLGSRREIEGWIEAGRVSVAGRVAKLGDRALPGDLVSVDGREIRQAAASQARVLIYHKPVGELVTRRDPQGRRTVFASLPAGRWVAVGRLDINSSGLLLLTDSGELANRLMHPRFAVEREYAARIRGELKPDERKRLLAGVALDGAPACFDRIEIQKKGEGANHWYRVVLREGRNREVRRLFAAVGHEVSRLVRVRYGNVELPPELAAGSWRELPAQRVKRLFVE